MNIAPLIFGLLISTSALADGMSTTLSLPNSTSLGQSQQQQQSADAAASNNGNNQSITIEASKQLERTETHISGTQTVKNVPSVSGPPLTTSNDTCMGSASGSANGPGFGLSLGKTYTDVNCVRLKNSRELWNMGMKAAALALMCMDKDNREALEVTGFVCPKKKEEESTPRFTYRND